MRSSQRLTAEGSTCARRAISSVSRWSQSFQARRDANCSAITPPPQPYSRSMVTRRNMVFLVYCHSTAGFGFSHQENRGDHEHDGDPEEPEAIDVRQHGGLALHRGLNQSISLLRCSGLTGSVSLHGARGSLHHVLKRGIGGTQIP